MKNIDLQKIAKAQDIKLVDIANHCGVDKSTVTRWNQRRVPIERVRQLAAFLNVDVGALRPDVFGDQ